MVPCCRTTSACVLADISASCLTARSSLADDCEVVLTSRRTVFWIAAIKSSSRQDLL